MPTRSDLLAYVRSSNELCGAVAGSRKNANEAGLTVRCGGVNGAQEMKAHFLEKTHGRHVALQDFSVDRCEAKRAEGIGRSRPRGGRTEASAPVGATDHDAEFADTAFRGRDRQPDGTDAFGGARHGDGPSDGASLAESVAMPLQPRTAIFDRSRDRISGQIRRLRVGRSCEPGRYVALAWSAQVDPLSAELRNGIGEIEAVRHIRSWLVPLNAKVTDGLQVVRVTVKLDVTMQEQLDGSNKGESEDAKSPSQDKGVRPDIR